VAVDLRGLDSAQDFVDRMLLRLASIESRRAAYSRLISPASGVHCGTVAEHR
jgi:hypothetical protein